MLELKLKGVVIFLNDPDVVYQNSSASIVQIWRMPIDPFLFTLVEMY